MPRRRRCTVAAPAAAEVNPFQAFAAEASAIDGQYRDALKQIEDSGLPPEHKKQLEVELADLLQEQVQMLCGRRSPDGIGRALRNSASESDAELDKLATAVPSHG